MEDQAGPTNRLEAKDSTFLSRLEIGDGDSLASEHHAKIDSNQEI